MMRHEEDLRRWAAEKAIEVYWDDKDEEKIFKLANSIVDFVKGEEDAR